MSLQRTDTGETSQPLRELQEMNERTRQETENALLKEALAISNEKSNDLIKQQNKLIAELRADIAGTESSLTDSVDRAVKEMQAETSKTERMRFELNGEVKKTISATVCDMKAEILKNVDSALNETKTQLAEAAKEIQRQKERMRGESKLRRFLLWAAPILLFVESVLLVVLLLR